MKVLVTGANGMLGSDCVAELSKRGHTAYGFSHAELDITDETAVRAAFSRIKPDAVLHCAAYTAVDAAEEAENREKALLVNVTGSRIIGRVSREAFARLVAVSTDYVFDGKGDLPRRPEEVPQNPVNFYGESKLLGEQALLSEQPNAVLVRTSWVFGQNGKNFVRTMLSLGKKHDMLRVVNDQFGTPTYTADLARLLVDFAESDRYGIYHATNEGGFLSWFEFAEEIFREAAALGHDEYNAERLKVLPVLSEEYGLSKAARPKNSRLDKGKLVLNGFTPLPPWKDALSRYLKTIEWSKL